MKIGIVDYGAGNLASVSAAFARLGVFSTIVSTAKTIEACEGIVIPGVGAFRPAMRRLTKLRKPIEDFTSSGRPLLGICLGMQVLFEEGCEGGPCKGLELLEGKVEKMAALKLPQVGWNSVELTRRCELFKGISRGEWFYFVNSFACAPRNKREVIGVTDYFGEFASVVQKRNVFGVQFHPEKSGRAGQNLLENFAGLVEKCK